MLLIYTICVSVSIKCSIIIELNNRSCLIVSIKYLSLKLKFINETRTINLVYLIFIGFSQFSNSIHVSIRKNVINDRFKSFHFHIFEYSLLFGFEFIPSVYVIVKKKLRYLLTKDTQRIENEFFAAKQYTIQ